MYPRLLSLIILFAANVPFASATGEPASDQGSSDPWAGCIQTLPLEANHPYFLPSHPRVTLTVRFPDQILDADGAGFTVNEGQVPGEYRISWREADDYLSITQLPGAQMRNLNVIVAGQTIVLVLYPVDSPLKAITSLTFVRPLTKSEIPVQQSRKVVFRSKPKTEPTSIQNSVSDGAHQDEHRPASTVEKRESRPDEPFEKVGPARLVGMIDRVKLLHSTRPDEMDSVLGSMQKVTVADFGTVFDQGMIRLQLVRVVRDSRLDLVGFVVIVRNVSKYEVVLDPESWAARVGLGYFPQATSDCQPKIPPGESNVAYFVVAGDGNGRPGYLSADNDWRVSVSILSPQLNPGASLSASFGKEIH